MSITGEGGVPIVTNRIITSAGTPTAATLQQYAADGKLLDKTFKEACDAAAADFAKAMMKETAKVQ